MKKKFQVKSKFSDEFKVLQEVERVGLRAEVELDENVVGLYQEQCIRFNEKPNPNAEEQVTFYLPRIIEGLEAEMRYFLTAISNEQFAYNVMNLVILNHLKEMYIALLAIFCPHLIEESNR